jgi:signal peptidase I
VSRRRRPRAVPPPLLVVVCVLLGVLAVLRFVAEPMRVSSGSMSPTFRVGDEVVVDKWGGRASHPRRGDVVVLRSPQDGQLVIKRVAALGGQRVGVADGVLVVDGRRVKEPYVDRSRVDGTYFGPVRVPRGALFVLGDQREGSIDSRAFGPVPADALVGRVVLRAWPR